MWPRSNISPKASLKKKSVSGGPAGCLKKGRLETFFFNFSFFFFFFSKSGQYFPTKPKKKKEKKRKNCGRPTGHNYGHPLDRKQTFCC